MAQTREVLGDPEEISKGKEVTTLDAQTGKQEGSQVRPQESSSLANKWEDDGSKKNGMDKSPENPGDIPLCHRCKVTGHFFRDCRRMNGYQRVAGAHQGNAGAETNLSDYVATLCAAQVDGQTFFCIPNRPSESHARERSTTAIVSIVKGIVTAR
jgi:hypothetical protein